MLVLVLVESMNIRLIEEIPTPVLMAITYIFVSIPSPHALPLLSTTIVFATPSHSLSSMIAQVMRTSYPFSFLFKV